MFQMIHNKKVLILFQLCLHVPCDLPRFYSPGGVRFRTACLRKAKEKAQKLVRTFAKKCYLENTEEHATQVAWIPPNTKDDVACRVK